VIFAGAVAAGALGRPAIAQQPIPQTDGWVLVVSRCVICHSVEIAVQQRQGPVGWGAIIDRMVTYGMPLSPDERSALVTYLVRHYGDPDGR
jgi:cytochrome c2